MADTTHQLAPAPSARVSQVAQVSIVLTGPGHVEARVLSDQDSVVIGRALPAAWIVDDPSLSRLHARVSFRDGQVHVEDVGSTNGTWLRGERVQQACLQEGEPLRLGNVEVRASGLVFRGSDDPRMLGYPAFRARVEHEVTRARVFGRHAGLVALRLGQLEPERVLPVLRAVDAMLVDGAVPLVLLPEATLESSRAFIDTLRRRLGEGIRAGVVLAPRDGASLEVLAERAVCALRDATGAAPVQVADAGRERPDSAAPIVRSEAMARLYDLVGRAARTSLPVLVLGETGSGKELVARTLHERSGRSAQPFKPLNCATIPSNLIESVLFGHERGAFTGADKQTPGLFEQAHGGTVFLDEVGELSLAAQAALLRVLELKRIVRVGGNREIDVDVRVVAATHRDLPSMVRSAQFREDLMFRLDALSVRVPPLRQRRDEIRPLADAFLARARDSFEVPAQGFNPDVYEAFETYDWPGNVRQLKNAVERAAAVCTGERIELEDLPTQIADAPLASEAVLPMAASGGFRPLPERVREFEIAIIREALDKAHGNQAQAARMLGVPRRTLANKVHAYGMLEG